MATYLSEGAEAGQNTATNPCLIFPLGRRKDLDPHIFHRQLLHFRQESVTETPCESAASREDNVSVQGLAEVEIGSVNGFDD